MSSRGPHTIVRITEEFLWDRTLIILERKALLKLDHDSGRYSFKLLTQHDVDSWMSRIGNNYKTSFGLNEWWPSGTSYHKIPYDDMMIVVKNFLTATIRDAVRSYPGFIALGAFTKEEIKFIYPHFLVEPQQPTNMMKEPRGKRDRIGLIANGRVSTNPIWFDYDTFGPIHTSVVGRAGSGKSVTAYSIAEGALLNNIPVLALDPTGQWTGFFKENDDPAMTSLFSQYGITKRKFDGRIFTPDSDVGLSVEANLLAKPETNDEAELSRASGEVTGIIKEFRGLSPTDAVKVRKKILDSWKQGRDLDCYSLKDNSFSDTLNNSLEFLVDVKFLFHGKGNFDFSTVLNSGKISVFALNDLDDSIMMFVSYFVLRKLIDHFDVQNDVFPSQCKLLLAVDEAHQFKGEALEMLKRVARTLRKKGVGLLIITQGITDMDPVIRTNTATKIYMNIQYPHDVDRAKLEIGDLADNLRNLQVGEGFAVFPGYMNPFRARFRPCGIYPHNLTSDEIRVRMNPYR